MDWLAALSAAGRAIALTAFIGAIAMAVVLGSQLRPQGKRWLIIPALTLLGVAGVALGAGAA